MEKTYSSMRFKYKKGLAIPLAVSGIIAIALILGLAIGLTRKHSSSNTSSQEVVVQNFPQEFLLSGNNFTISNQTTTRYYEFNVSQISGSPDGYQRTMLVVNGQYPGPLIECNTGDTLIVKVNNQLSDGQGTSIHWHVSDQRGTYWWHSHNMAQYTDGILGPLIIHDPSEPFINDYDEDIIMILSDGHNLTVVEADGVAMNPVTITRLPINVAQRYSLIVEANQPIGNYWARAVMNENCFAYTNPALNPAVLAGIHYEGALDNQPNTTDPGYTDPVDCIDLDSSELRPSDGLDAPAYNVSYYVEATFQAITEDRIHYGYMNTTTWTALSNTNTLQESNAGISSFGSSQFVLTVPDNATVIQMIIQSKRYTIMLSI
ncbi:unnamed protein product [Umbelopsis sp. WA50703]